MMDWHERAQQRNKKAGSLGQDGWARRQAARGRPIKKHIPPHKQPGLRSPIDRELAEHEARMREKEEKNEADPIE